jgi:hypothetical protein
MDANLRSVLLFFIMKFDLHVCSVSAGSASASKDEVKRLPGGKLKKKVGSLTVPNSLGYKLIIEATACHGLGFFCSWEC